MSTKNLARTVIEGGRARHNCWERRHSNAVARRWEARVSGQLLTVIEVEEVVYRRRPKVYRAFRDKLGPAQRWLETQAGRPWNKVRSDLVQRFDTRTTAGRHILYDHLLPSVEGGPRQFSPPEFTVDQAGILKRKRPRGLPHPVRERLAEPTEQERSWIAARRVGLRGSAHFWFVPTESGAFRQDRRLTPAEATRFLALPRSYRDQCDALRAHAS